MSKKINISRFFNDHFLNKLQKIVNLKIIKIIFGIGKEKSEGSYKITYNPRYSEIDLH